MKDIRTRVFASGVNYINLDKMNLKALPEPSLACSPILMSNRENKVTFFKL